jgi:hypothetical protein
MRRSLPLLLALTLGACDPGPSDDTAPLDTGEPTIGDRDGDGYTTEDGDCDDGDPAVHPGADELCNGVDDDCDDLVDEDPADAATWYPDADGDGYGSEADAVASCEQPEGSLSTGGDCDDGDDAVHPGATELDCDLLDNDCDGVADGGLRVPHDHATVQQAIDAASTGDTICVAAGTHRGSVDFSGKGVAVVGVEGAEQTVLTTDRGRVVTIASREPAGARLQGLSITGGTAELGAGIYIDGATVELDSVTVSANLCPQTADACQGTGLAALDSQLEIRDLWLEANQQQGATNHGAGAWLLRSTVHWTGGGATGNEQAGDYDYGAGIATQDSEIEIEGALLRENAQVGRGYGGHRYGAGLWASGGDVLLRQTAVEAQEQSATAGTDARFHGAGLCFSGTQALLEEVTVQANLQVQHDGDVCYAYGAGVYAAGGSVTLTGTQLLDNTTEVDGFVTYAYAAGFTGAGELILEASDARIEGNAITGGSGTLASGGGLYLRGTWTASLANSTIAGNTVEAGYAYGVGLAAYEYGELSLTNVIVAGNEGAAGTQTKGAGLFVYYTDAMLQQVDLVGNRCGGGGASCEGAALYPKYQAHLHLDGCHIVANDSGGGGGAASSYDGTEVGVTLAYSGVWDNGSNPWDNLGAALVVGDGLITEDPLFADTSGPDPSAWDLALQPGSPSIDAGNPSALDPDGSRADIGAYGGPRGAW